MKARGGERVMYATKSAWWDAKNRFGLPDMLPLDYAAIAHLFAPAAPVQQLMERAEQMQIPTEMLADSAPADTLPQQRDFPGALADLMTANRVLPSHIEKISSEVFRYFPAGMPMREYPKDYHEWLCANWKQVMDAVRQNCHDYVPF